MTKYPPQMYFKIMLITTTDSQLYYVHLCRIRTVVSYINPDNYTHRNIRACRVTHAAYKNKGYKISMFYTNGRVYVYVFMLFF